MVGTLIESERMAAVAKALGHPARMQIIELLASQAECRGADVFGELALAQSTVSEHLRVLKSAGVVTSSPDGPAMVYCLDYSMLDEIAGYLNRICAEAELCGSVCAKGEC